MNKIDFRQLSFFELKAALGEHHVNSEFIVGDPSQLNVPTDIFNEPIQLEGSALALCLEGEAVLTLNLQRLTLRQGHMLVIPGNSVIQYHEHLPDFKSYIVGISREFFDGMQLKTILPIMSEIMKNPLLELSEQDIRLIVNWGRYISGKSIDENNPYHKQIMQHLILSLFYEIGYIFLKQRGKTVVRQKTHSEEIMEQFARLVREHYRTERNVEFYADQLCLTPKYLSTLIKKNSGKSVPEWIRYALIMDAKVQLKYSTQTVQQISEMLQFPNPSFFGRFFKKYVGITPLQYRMGE
ncbi:MAG: AraC family transcriptional regulator [Rikenellaceae bacterium]|nr:AraC family transcriptional regulator [Rikenellaceae bacterium]